MISIDGAITSELSPININGKKSNRLMVVLKTKGCSYARKFDGCKHCTLIQNSNQKITSNNLKNQLEAELKKYNNQEYHHLDLLTLGSFFDEDEIPNEFFEYALERITKIQTLESIMVESRPEYITRGKLESALRILDNKKLEVGIGLESSNDFVREILLNKGFSLSDLEHAVKLLADFNVGFVSYIIVKPVGLSEKEAIEDAIQTIKYAFALGKKYKVQTRIALGPFYIPRNSPAEIKYNIGEYNPPKLWSIMEVLRKTSNLGAIFVGLNDEGLSDGLIASNCKLCNSRVIDAIQKYNGDNEYHNLSKLNCSCKKQWEDSIGGKK